MTAQPTTRPLMRYHGGKWKLAPWIIQNLPPHSEYVELYGGALSVLLRKPRSQSETINDLDSDIVALYRVLRNPAQAAQLVEYCHLTPFAREEFEEAYQPSDDPVEQARRLIFRSFAGVGSVGATRGSRTGFRYLKHASEGVTAADSWVTYPDALAAIIERLQKVIVEHLPAVDLAKRYTHPDTLLYADPPYLHSTRSGERGYRHEMTLDDHAELADTLKRSPCLVAVSGYPSPIYDDLYAGWQYVTCTTHAFGSSAIERKSKTEVLWLNPAAWAAIEHRGLFAKTTEDNEL